MSRKDAKDLSQQELIQLVEGFEKLMRAASGLFRQIGKRELTPHDAATRLQIVAEGRAPDAAMVGNAPKTPRDAPPASRVSERRRMRRTNRAQQYVRKGEFAKAITQLERLLDSNPHDVRTLLKIGDLHARRGDVAAATDTYLKVAAFYAEQGFYLKAIAVYKQILKIDEGLTECHVRLADLYHQLGLMQDAVHEYCILAAAYDRNGNVHACLTTWRKIVELDSQNIQHRIKLAEAYAKRGITTQAVQEFAHVARVLQEQRRMDDWQKVAERIVHLDPSQQDLIRDLARHYLTCGQPKRALAKLQGCYRTNPEHVGTLALLVQAFTVLGRQDHAQFVRDALMRIHHRVARGETLDTTPDQPDPSDPLAQEATRMVDELIERIAGNDAVSDNDAPTDGDALPPKEAAEAWRYWAAHGPQGPIADDSEDALHGLRQHWDATLRGLAALFADIATPTLNGPTPALRGLAMCHDRLGDRGKAIEAYEALIARSTDDPNPPAWLAEVRQCLLALKANPQS